GVGRQIRSSAKTGVNNDPTSSTVGSQIILIASQIGNRAIESIGRRADRVQPPVSRARPGVSTRDRGTGTPGRTSSRGPLMYLAYGLLQPGSDFSLDAAAGRLAARFPGWSVTRSGEEVHVTQGEWEFKLRLNAEDYVAGESAGLSGRIAGL